jgi:hypothetical protein
MSLKDLPSEAWEALYENWRKSGLSQREFCGLQKIEYKAFAYRREKASLAKRRAESGRALKSPGPKVTPKFIPIEIAQKSLNYSWIEIQLPHGIILRIPAHEVA